MQEPAKTTRPHDEPALPKRFKPTELSLDYAREYEQTRFHRRARSRRVDRWEKALVRKAHAAVGDDSHVLDVPCGSGRLTPIFANVRQLTLADRSPSMLQACRERVGDRAGVTFVETDICALPLPSDSVDLVLCMRLFHHFPDDAIRSAALAELARVSRRFVAMTFYNQRCLRFLRRKLLGRKFRGQYTTFSRIRELAATHGLTPAWRRPIVNVLGQQTFVMFRKA